MSLVRLGPHANGQFLALQHKASVHETLHDEESLCTCSGSADPAFAVPCHHLAVPSYVEEGLHLKIKGAWTIRLCFKTPPLTMVPPGWVDLYISSPWLPLLHACQARSPAE